jgi:two-component system, LuxR family, sensor kinase FixL
MNSEQRIDELERAQQRLRASEELYRHVVELSSLIPWTSDDDGNILTVGERWTDWTGAPVAAALGTGWIAYLHPDDHGHVLPAWAEALRNGTPLQLEYRLRTAAGDYRWCHVRTRRRGDGGEAASLWYGTLEDIHERRTALDAYHRAQADLAHVSRLSAMGAMATAIAHDLNQPLTASVHYIRGCRSLLAGIDGPAKDEVEAGLDGADANIVRASDIVRRVREFVSRGSVDRGPERLIPLIDGACDFALGDAAARGIVHRSDYRADCVVMVDRVQVQQVLVNVIRNAVEALDGAPRREIVFATRKASPDLCEVRVTDTGPGIAPEAAARLFDPFYTTRAHGMGMGLSISRTIVEAHGGSIRHEAPPSGGTTIAFTLPIAPDPGTAPAPASAG